MDNNLATVCLITLGVLIVLFLAAILLLRVVRGSIFGLGMMVMRVITEAKEEPAATPVVQAQSQQPTINDLRARAQALDFDAAVAKHRAENPQPTVHPVPPPSAFPPATPPPNNDQSGGWPHP